MKRARTLRAVIAYKVVRGAGSLALALALLGAIASGHVEALVALVRAAQGHTMTAWIGVLIGHVHASSPRVLWLSLAALAAADGALALLEGWALARGRWWGPWLVVFLTGALLPGELIALARHASLSRATLLLLNLAVVVYLSRSAKLHAKG